MEEKSTLFEYLFRNLREQIMTGYLKYGDPLPSMSQLSENYHVGIRTVREVLAALKREGLIHTEERRTSRVAYQPVDEIQKEDVLRSVLERRTAILEVYKTMELIMPRLFACSIASCGGEKVRLSFQHLKRNSKKGIDLRWKASSMALHSLLDASGNLLFRDIFTSLEICARVPFFLEFRESPAFSASAMAYKDPMWMLEAANSGDLKEMRRCFETMYRAIADDVKQFLEELDAMVPFPVEETDCCYSWSPEIGRNHYYMQITRDLIDKIGVGIYRDGTFLPSEAALADEYKVSVSTIRKAVAMLNKCGFCHTYNVKGTQVTLFNDDATAQCMKNRVLKNDTLLYLSGLQFMAAAVWPAAMLTAESIKKEAEELVDKMEQPWAVPLDLITDAMKEHLPLKPFQMILQEVGGLLHWGYYYSFYSDGSTRSNKLNQRCRIALDCLMKGEKQAYARQLSLCYCHVLEVVREYMVQCGLYEAKNLITPQPEQWEEYEIQNIW